MTESALGQSGTHGRRVMRSSLALARGLGAAHSGVTHWWVQRLTAVALVPLSLWFIVAMLHLLGAGQPEVVRWAHHPINVVLLLCLILASFQHMQLGLQVIIEDYVHNKLTQLATLLVMKAITLLLALSAIIAALKLAFSQ
ncbi:MAG: succinate dehydrogenase, hydrophobic membrane anchor protein [Acetobacteraceae bacterium]|nr:succinate dehydrogenase, hydrophobic membrane anchor protein [Acetobacteraceae bacterium]